MVRAAGAHSHVAAEECASAATTVGKASTPGARALRPARADRSEAAPADEMLHIHLPPNLWDVRHGQYGHPARVPLRQLGSHGRAAPSLASDTSEACAGAAQSSATPSLSGTAGCLEASAPACAHPLDADHTAGGRDSMSRVSAHPEDLEHPERSPISTRESVSDT